MKLLILSLTGLCLPLALQPVQQETAAMVRVHIEIIADSSNTLQAQVEAPRGEKAQALLDRLFRAGYADAGKKFVNEIAGFRADGRRRQFWALEINGELAKVGIAEIVLQEDTHIRWHLRTY